MQRSALRSAGRAGLNPNLVRDAHGTSFEHARKSGKRSVHDLHTIPTPQTQTQSHLARAIDSRANQVDYSILRGQRLLATAKDSACALGPANARKVRWPEPCEQVGGKKGAKRGATSAGLSLGHQGEEYLAAEVPDTPAHKGFLARVRLDDVPAELFHAFLTGKSLFPLPATFAGLSLECSTFRGSRTRQSPPDIVTSDQLSGSTSPASVSGLDIQNVTV